MLKKLLKSEIKLNSRQKTALYITLVYAVITFLLCLKHEMWSDELNVWMAIKHYSFPELIKFSSEAGNPIFFFLPLLPFIKLGFSAHFIQIFCWLCSVSAVFLLNFLAPFGTVTKILITFGAPMLYHYSVMARCYSVLPPLMFLTAVLYPYICLQESAESCKTDRDSILLKNTAVILYACCIAAIACTHIITFVFVAGLTALFVYKNIIKNKKRSRYEWAAAAIMTAGIIIVTAQTLYALSVNTVFDHVRLTAYGVWYAAANLFISMADSLAAGPLYNIRPNCILIKYFTPAVALSFLLGIVLLYRINRFFAAVTMGTVIFYIYIAATSYSPVFSCRSFVSLIVLISLVWAASAKRNCDILHEKRISKATEYVIAILMLLTVPAGIEISANDWKKNFSSGVETADFIKKHIPADNKNAIISTMVPIAYYLPDRPVYYEYKRKLVTILKKSDSEVNLSAFAGEYENIYIVMPAIVHDLLSGEILLYESPETLSPAEHFRVYKLRKRDTAG
ncbi:MAG: hypothetical protein J6Z08_07045 [Elusimicrobiales bacterium]|nr:hypothetical protein [Elusimicrobiales bacterium]